MPDKDQEALKETKDDIQDILKSGNRMTDSQQKQTSAAEKIRDFRVGKEIGS